MLMLKLMLSAGVDVDTNIDGWDGHVWLSFCVGGSILGVFPFWISVSAFLNRCYIIMYTML